MNGSNEEGFCGSLAWLTPVELTPTVLTEAMLVAPALTVTVPAPVTVAPFRSTELVAFSTRICPEMGERMLRPYDAAWLSIDSMLLASPVHWPRSCQAER